MKRIKRALLGTCAFLAITGSYDLGLATVSLYDPTWEAPGGYIQNPSGISPAHSGGKNWDYSEFDPMAYAALYYVTGDYDYDPGPPEVWAFYTAGPAIGTFRNGMTRLYYDVSASDLLAGKVVWSADLHIYDAIALTNQRYQARFTLSVYDRSSNPFSLLDASTLDGMDARVGGTHQIVGGFGVNWLYELSHVGVNNWQAAMPFFDSLSTDPSDFLQTSVTRAFYYIGCFGNVDRDSDVDGVDLAAFVINPAGISVGDFAAYFGEIDCP